ncbi:substrate-binding domain-containing protein [Cryobacterium sp. 10C3]|uniref:substrate-binding domain-containing protein n=1 Tax=Cryobacterium sp. 10C3 TaxID=3048577 RepID=UPI002AB43E64|nr:substrate-binding domain-containing protein [Cryobacterium sp. 10C3]MDY7558652.1 substrate-binding domain-containing protein [Cryobacterium sp. 10C3]
MVVDPAGEPTPDVPSIGSANWSGGLAATRHLIDLGHTRIGMIGGPVDMLCSVARIGGYRAALEAAGIAYDSSLVLDGDFHPEGARVRAVELLDRPDRPTAIFAGSDLQAMGVYEAARALGLLIPADLSVVGYDDLPSPGGSGRRMHDDPAAAHRDGGGRGESRGQHAAFPWRHRAADGSCDEPRHAAQHGPSRLTPNRFDGLFWSISRGSGCEGLSGQNPRRIGSVRAWRMPSARSRSR